MTETSNNEKAVSNLEALCRGELAAVETYNTALASASLGRIRPQLIQCQRSHQNRVHLLGWRIHLLGGTPPESSGAWGVFAKALESAATIIGERAAIATLEEGEDHGLNEYRSRLSELDEDTRDFIQARVLPAQTETHAIARALKLDPPSSHASV
jgi:demethoxyubiquinone hydroxylase (CLK1/Coq7/Cat5 family)